MQARSKQYDWFKGSDDNGKPDAKKRLKTTWRITKIFLYFTLFFFSMWGCVQVFTMKTNPTVAGGTTFANGDSKLSPQVGRVNVTNNSKLDKAPFSIYFTKETDFAARNIDDGAKVIDDVNKELKNVGVDSPTDAIGGGNFVGGYRNSEGKSLFLKNDEPNGIVYDSNSPLLFTTAKNNSKDNWDRTKQTIKGYLSKSFFFYTYRPVAGSTDKYEVTGRYEVNLGELVKDDATMEKFFNNKENKMGYYFNAVMLDKFLQLKIGEVDSSVTSLATTSIEDFLKTEPSGAVLKKGDQIDATVIQKITAQRSSLEQILQNVLVAKYKIDTTKQTFTWSSVSAYPYAYASRSWKPMTTWGSAWTTGFGPFYGLFVWPIAYVSNAIIDGMPILKGWESFLTIVFIVCVISIIMFGLNFKNTMQQTKMQELSAKKAIIDAKYAAYKDNKQMQMRQKSEVQALYKKEGISPLSSLGGMFITMPFFLAMWRVIGSIDHIKGTTWLGIKFSATSWRMLIGNLGQWQDGWSYFPLMLMASGIQVFSQIYPKLLTKRRNKNRMNIQQKQAMKKSNKTQNIMIGVFGFMALIFTAGLQVYFIVRSLWRIMELSFTHFLIVRKHKRRVTTA